MIRFLLLHQHLYIILRLVLLPPLHYILQMFLVPLFCRIILTHLLVSSTIYTHPIVTLPPPHFQIHTGMSPHHTPPVYSSTASTHRKLHPSPAKGTTRYHPYLPKTSGFSKSGKSPTAENYPTSLSELSKITGQKCTSVSNISKLFPTPSKKLATYSTFQDRMLLVAHSLISLKNSPLAQESHIPFPVASSSPDSRLDKKAYSSSTPSVAQKGLQSWG